jgi:hypothetical protein
LVLNLFLFAITGAVLELSQLKEICISGPALVMRARQLTWRLTQNIADKINSSPGIKSVATDDTEIHKRNAGARAVSFVDLNLRKPAYEFISGAPTGRKTSEAGAEALVLSLKESGINFVGMRGGSSDNAPNARNTVFDFFSLAQREVHGTAVGPDGDALLTIFNGVPVRCIWVGSGVQILHLLFNNFRKASFGSKGGMDEASGGQLPFKWNAVIRSDQQVSKGMSVYRILLIDFFGGNKGFWTTLMTEENEGRW